MSLESKQPLKKLLVVAGTRPEIIKLAPVILAGGRREGVDIHFCATGQHAVMAEEASTIFGITADSNLTIMRKDQSLNDICRSVFERLPEVIDRVKPDVLVVQGDTTTAAISALVAFNKRLPVAHVEAGLRSGDLAAPFPEEANRRIISVLATYNFCPTERARAALEREGAARRTLHVTGNTVVDALEIIRGAHALDDLAAIHTTIRPPFVLVTGHRRESFGAGFENICAAVRDASQRWPDLQFVYPVHLNPNVEGPVRTLLGGLRNVVLLRPIPYLQLLTLMKHADFVLTDSGGIQEEAPSFDKYCIVMRTVTERQESVDAGYSELVGTDREAIISAIERQQKNPSRVVAVKNPYGDGRSSERILSILVKS